MNFETQFKLLDGLFFTTLVLALLSIACSVVSMVKLASCNFEAPYKREIITAVGIIPPFGLVTVWLDINDDVPLGLDTETGESFELDLTAFPDVED